MKSVAVVVGSLREGSINRILAKALERLASERLAFDYLDIGALPMFNQDLEADRPASVLDLKQRVEAADGVLLVTPEYNRAPPPVLLNALSWGSRPYGKSSWDGKPAGIVGASPGVLGASAAQSVLRGIAASHGLTLMTRPEVYLQVTPDLIGDDGAIAKEDTAVFLGSWVDAFDAFVGRFAD